jgi:hypothetical protein
MKSKNLCLMVILMFGTVLLFPSRTYPLYTGKEMGKQTQAEFSPTRLIVKVKTSFDSQITLGRSNGIATTSLADFDSLNFKFKVTQQERLFGDFRKTALRSDKLSSVYLLEVPAGTDLNRMKKEYEGMGEVEYAELDYRFELFDAPDDPLFSNQWYLNNTGQGYLGINRIPGNYNDTQVIKYGTVDADVDALEAWERNDETVLPLVGIIDTGVDLDHPDLAANIWTNPGEIPGNDIDDDHNGFVDDYSGWDFSGYEVNGEIMEDDDPTDYYGHGTHCAGIVASVRGNGIGVSGINTPCRIMAVKVFPYAYFSVCAKGIIYAADMGCDVINMSWGSPFPSHVIADALDYAISKGVLPIAASGNSGAEDSFYPASLPQVFTVGASNSDDEVTEFSTYGSQIDVVAPGQDILSLRADNTDMYAEGGASGTEPFVHIVNQNYYLADGTSMASPCAVGVAAYVLAASPGISISKVKEILQTSADDIIYPYGGDSLYSPGKDIYSGYGRVNLNSALQLISGRLAKIDFPYENAIVSENVVVLGTASGDSFQNYVLEYGEGYSPSNWTVIANSSVPKSHDTLGVWNSSALSGRFTLRLTVGSSNQAVVHVVVDNSVKVGITSPQEGDTVSGNVEIRGNTVVPDFSHYTLQYGFGDPPSYWTDIVTSTKMVADGMLGNWMASFLAESDFFALRLLVVTNGGQTYADTVTILVENPAFNWSLELTSFGCLSPGVGDIDGDGWDEIVVGIGGPAAWGRVGGIEVFNHQGQLEPGWPKDTDKNMMSSPALGDLNNDGIDDIVIACEQDGVHAYLSGGGGWIRNAVTSWNQENGLAVPVIADLENDGYLEVFTINNQGTVYGWRNDGNPIIPGDGVFAQAGVSSNPMGFPSLAVADLDGDGENEVIAGIATGGCNPLPCLSAGGIYIWDREAHLLLSPANYPEKFTCLFGMAVANVDEDDDMEIVVVASDTCCMGLYAFKKDGTQAANYPIKLEDLKVDCWFANPPAIGDLEGDGILEIVMTAWALGDARIYAWHQDGTPLGSLGGGGLLVSLKSKEGGEKPALMSPRGSSGNEGIDKIMNPSTSRLSPPLSITDDPIFASVPETFGSPVLADINRDGSLEIIAQAGYYTSTGYERIFAWDYEGNLISGFPLYVTDEASAFTYSAYVPVIADLDKDKKLDVVTCSNDNNYITPHLVAWEFDTYYDPVKMHWPRCMHDQWNSSVFRLEDYDSYDVSDVVYLINYLFLGGPPPVPFEHGDVNHDGALNISDVIFLINYLFKAGPPPSF